MSGRVKVFSSIFLSILIMAVGGRAPVSAMGRDYFKGGYGQGILDLNSDYQLLYASAKPELSQESYESSSSSEADDLMSQMNLRSKKIQLHKTLGLVAAGLFSAALFTGNGAKGGTDADLDRHAYLAYAAGAVYATSGFIALNAPKNPGGPRTLGGKIHKALAWVHFPAMVLTILSGVKAKDQKEAGKSTSGLGDLHIPAATVTAVTFYSSIVVVYF